MANKKPVARSEEQELLRQISFTKTLIERAPEREHSKAAAALAKSVEKYTARLELLEAKLASL